ncbi:hypothetical protein K2Z83_08735, partial [Oscillochloris sp. ZM17-4]|uniref:hypothetical protein n=1 Tax=Oscillochloris sp. ZM17-4 TaxID=2866714 RepID=UPI001C7334BC
MHASRICAVIALASTLLLTACSSNSADLPYQTTPVPATPIVGQDGAYPYPYPAPPLPSTDTSAYPEPAPSNRTFEGRSQTVIASYAAASACAAQHFNADALLYEVVPSRAMLQNIGNPPTALGWFYKFRSQGSDGDLFVQIVDGTCSSPRELIPLGELPKAELPIDVAALKIDSDQAIEIFQKHAVAQGIPVMSDPYDLQLINLEGTPGPVWGVISPLDNRAIYWIDAITGEERS